MVSKLSIIIPIFNEEQTIYPLLQKVLDIKFIQGVEKEILIIDDKSKDDSINLVQEFIEKNQGEQIRLICQESNSGKGAAIRRGFREVTGDYLIIQDADLELKPEEINLLLEPVCEGVADVVFGSRYRGGKPRRVNSYRSFVANRLLTNFSNLLSGLALTDMETCYKLIRTDLAKNIDIKENRFGFEPEITAKLAKVKGIRVYEVGISFYARTVEDGKKIGFKDGVRALYCILKYNL